MVPTKLLKYFQYSLLIITVYHSIQCTAQCTEDVDMSIWYTGSLNSTYSSDCYTVYANKTNTDHYYLRVSTVPVDPSSPYIESICTEIPSIGYQECVDSGNVDASDLICLNATDGYSESNVIYINVHCLGTNCPVNTSIEYQIYFGWVSGTYVNDSQCTTDGIPLPMGGDGIIYWSIILCVIFVLFIIGAVISGIIIFKKNKSYESI